MQESLHCPPPPMSQSSATRLSPRMAGGGIFWTVDGGTGFSMDPGWKEGVFCGTLDGGRRYTLGPWREGGGILWDPGWREEVNRGTLEKAQSIFLL